MKYLKNFFHHFLLVFFADQLLPGIEVLDQTKWPHLGADVLFSSVLGLLNSLIYPFLKFVQKANLWRLILACAILNFSVYAVLKVLPIGIHLETLKGYLFCSVAVSVGSFLINFLEFKQNQHHHYYDDSPKFDGMQ